MKNTAAPNNTSEKIRPGTAVSREAVGGAASVRATPVMSCVTPLISAKSVIAPMMTPITRTTMAVALADRKASRNDPPRPASAEVAS